MTPEQFEANAIALLGTVVDWQTKIAKILEVNDRTVRSWVAHTNPIPIPDWVEQKFQQLTGQTDLSPYPRDEWVIGDHITNSRSQREYIVHMQFPRFVARIVSIDPDTEKPESSEEPADIISGIVYGANEETLLCEINWIDPVDTTAALQWLEAAADEIERQTDLLFT